MFHNILHGFWEGRGTGNAALEAKLLQQLMAMREEVLFEVLLDLRKAYDTLDCERELEIITAYRVGLRTVRILWTYWYRLTMVAKASTSDAH